MTEEKTKEKQKNIYQRIQAVMLDVDYVQKEAKTVNNQYRFVSHDAVVAAVRPALLKHGVVVESCIKEKTLELQEVEENVMVYDNQAKTKTPMLDSVTGEPIMKKTVNYLAKVFIEFEFVNVDDPQDRYKANGWGMGIDPQDKATGKAVSYAKKYALLNALLLETGDDPEQDINYKVTAPQKVAPKPDKPISASKQFFSDYYRDLAAASDLDSLNIVLVSNATKKAEMLATYDVATRENFEPQVKAKEDAAKARLNAQTK